MSSPSARPPLRGEHAAGAARPANRRAVVPPKQARSRESYERVLRATDELLRERHFAEITVNDICIAADISPSSLYGRFVTKDAVRATRYQQHLGAAFEALEGTLTRLREETVELEELLRTMLGRFLQFCKDERHVIVSIWEDDVLREDYWRTGLEIEGAITQAALDLLGATDPEARRAVQFGTRIAASSLQRATGVPVNFGERLGYGDDEIVERMTQMLAGYLRHVI